MARQFIKSMEINGITPLPHYYEEIFANRAIERLGLRGDRNYLFYSCDGHGAGYYEAREMALSAESVAEHFRSKKQRTVFFGRIAALLREYRQATARLEKTDLATLDGQTLARLFLEANQLHGRAFALYIVSQPYRIKRLEDNITLELRKRVAVSRTSHYLAELATSHQPTLLSRETDDWLKLLIAAKRQGAVQPIRVKSLQQDDPSLYAAVQKHFDKYKTLTLGDGKWHYDINHFLDILQDDIGQPVERLERQLADRQTAGRRASRQRRQLIKALRLSSATVADLDFLAAIGHSRLQLRIEGWVPFIRQIIRLDIALSERLGLGKQLNFMSEAEIAALAAGQPPVSQATLAKRMGHHQEFLILNEDGKYHLYYGEPASRRFRQLVPAIDHSRTTELRGATAVPGVVSGTACVYNWGDDIAAKLKVIKRHPILVTGQTRPQMMAIIRHAKGVVTDEGGVTSHAAIVSRELGIPSVIGTLYATKTFRDGDKIEIDADHGIVRKLA